MEEVTPRTVSANVSRSSIFRPRVHPPGVAMEPSRTLPRSPRRRPPRRALERDDPLNKNPISSFSRSRRCSAGLPGTTLAAVHALPRVVLASEPYLSASVLVVRDLLSYARSHGVDVDRLLPELGILPALLEDPDARVPEATNERAWAEVAAATRDEALGIHAAQQSVEGAFEVFDYAMYFSSTLREGLDRMARFYRLLADVAAIEVVSDGNVTHVRRLVGGTRPQQQDFYFALVCVRLRAGSGREIRPREVCFEHAPHAQTELADFFGCPIRFGRAQSDLVLASAESRPARASSEAAARSAPRSLRGGAARAAAVHLVVCGPRAAGHRARDQARTAHPGSRCARDARLRAHCPAAARGGGHDAQAPGGRDAPPARAPLHPATQALDRPDCLSPRVWRREQFAAASGNGRARAPRRHARADVHCTRIWRVRPGGTAVARPSFATKFLGDLVGTPPPSVSRSTATWLVSPGLVITGRPRSSGARCESSGGSSERCATRGVDGRGGRRAVSRRAGLRAARQSGRTNPSLAVIVSMATALGIRLGELLEEES